ncbi:MAG: exodeoxyribonuclease VII large subunit [Planctomycetota bacterium]
MSLFDPPPPIPPARGPEPRPVLGVAQLTERIAGQLKGMGLLAVQGEVSGLKQAGSGHLYFQLKEAGASLSCAMWRSRVAAGLRFDLSEGAQVICHGRLDVYAPRGGYSLIVERIEPLGMGALLARLEALKNELRGLGWFDRKRPIPAWPRRIGLVTSRDADALRDFLRTRSLRWSGFPVRLCHTRVQGPGAADEIAHAIARLDDGTCDVICVVRGGGSIEDLWAFNERVVAEAVWNCSVPVISGVGHESDTTLIDLVADLRGHTPTNAAENAIPDREAWSARLERAQAYMERAMERRLAQAETQLAALGRRASLASPAGFLRAPEQRIEGLARRLEQGLESRLHRSEARLTTLEARLAAGHPMVALRDRERRLQAVAPRLGLAMERRMERAAARLERVGGLLEAISPLAVLDRGYAILHRAADGSVVRGPADAPAQTPLVVTLKGGRIAAVAGEELPS